MGGDFHPIFAGLVAICQHPRGPATGHLDTGFFDFSLSWSISSDSSLVPSCHFMFLMQTPGFKLIKINPLGGSTELHFQIIQLSLIKNILKIHGPCSKPPFVFNIHSTPARRTSGVAWKTLNGVMFFFPLNKKWLSHFPLLCLSYTLLLYRTSLSLYLSLYFFVICLFKNEKAIFAQSLNQLFRPAQCLATKCTFVTSLQSVLPTIFNQYFG